MKKLILSLIAMAIIIISSILLIVYFKSSSEKMVEAIEKTTSLVAQNSWEEAKTSIKNIEIMWDDTEKIWTVLTDHFEVDNIEMSLKKSKEYIETQNLPLTLAELESLKFMMEHMHKKEQFNLKNIF